MGYDGWVVVGTKLDTKQLEKDLKVAERKLTAYEKEAEKLTKAKAKAEADLEPYERERKEIERTYKIRTKNARSELELKVAENERQRNLEKINDQYAKQRKNVDDINRKIKENAKNQGLLRGQIAETNANLNRSKGFDNIKDIMKDIGKETSKTIKKVARWALAIFSVRTAYGTIRRAMSTLSTYNEQLATDMEYMSFAIAKALESTILRIVEIAYRLLSYINYIAKAWFDINLFAGATADAMNKGAISANQMKKALAGFDEMNVISDTSSVAGSKAPSIDLSQIDASVPEFIDKIAQNKDAVLGFFQMLALIWGSMKILDIAKAFGLIGTNIGTMGVLLKGLGIGVLLYGIVDTIKKLKEYLEEPTWENYAQYLYGIGIILGGLALIIGGPTGLVVAIIGAVVTIVAGVVENWEKIKEILGKVGGWIYDYVIVPVVKFFEAMFDTIWSVIKLWFSYVKGLFALIFGLITNPFVTAKDTVLGIFKGMETFIKGFIQVIKSLFQGDLAGVFEGFKMMFKGIMDSLWSIAKAPLNLVIGGINSLIRGLNKISIDVPDWLGGGYWGIRIPEIPRLAVGGIINLPSRGVPIGGAIGGEAGPEGVIPLTDTQAMETLGATIGKYITVNANITNTMNGRVISRELKKINAENDFAFNR